ncbi:MAG: hypothetical protein R3D86_06825 [Emcibacteraceae bacterium]
MEFLNTIINYVFSLAIVITPILAYFKIPTGNTRERILSINLYSLPIILILLIMVCYWPSYYQGYQLENLGYDQFGMSEAERLANVAPEFHDRATMIYNSNFGIGWPLRVIMGFMLILPYPTMVMLLISAIQKKLPTKTVD